MRPRPRVVGGLFSLVLIVWAILFLMIRFTFHFPANPALTFVILFALFFLALFIVRFGIFRARRWWENFRPGLVRLLHKLLNRR